MTSSASPHGVRGRRKVFVGVKVFVAFRTLRFGVGVANAAGMLVLALTFPSTTAHEHKGHDGVTEMEMEERFS